MDKDERLKLDYEQTSKYFYHLADVRFKLLALVPTVTGTAVGLLGEDAYTVRALIVGILGFFVTFGVVMYDQRNTQIYDAMVKRAKGLEALLELESVDTTKDRGGAFTDRPRRSRYLLGILMWHDRALAIVYSTALAAWGYLAIHGLLGTIDLRIAFVRVGLEVLVPIVLFMTFVKVLRKFDEATDEPAALTGR